MEVDALDLPSSVLPFVAWPWRGKTRERYPGEEFFYEGNIECMVKCKFITEIDEEKEDKTRFEVPSFQCHIVNCGKTFTSVAKYEMHYQAAHRNVCQECHQCLPTGHLLDIHLLELHNPMFEIQSQHQAMYRCLVEQCQEKFTTPENRKEHLMESHKYPANFRFHRLVKNKRNSRDAHDRNSSNKVLEQLTDNSYIGSSQCPMNTVIEVTKKENNAADETSAGKFSYKVPQNICFGKVPAKTFYRQAHGGKKIKRKMQWRQKVKDIAQTKTNIEEVDMMDLADALD